MLRQQNRIHSHPNPLIYLKGITYKDLLSVLDFMYHGEVNVAQDDLNSFLSVAEELQIKGLTNKEQSDTAGVSSSKTGRPEPGRSKDPGPPLKRIRKSSQTLPSHYQDPSAGAAVVLEDDDVKEVVKIKLDPEVSLSDNPEEAVIPDEEVYDESYGEYYDESVGLEGDGEEEDRGAEGTSDGATGKNSQLTRV